MSKLESLKEEISSLATQINQLKASNADGDSVKAVVDQLVAAKRQYAELNGGIGVDGQPYVEKLTKAQKKAKVKEEKGDATKPAGEEMPQGDPDSANSLKKAAKKAEKAAKKAALKASGSGSEQGSVAAVVPSTSPVVDPSPAPVSSEKEESKQKKPSAASLPSHILAAGHANEIKKLTPNAILWNPQATSAVDKPYVALVAAVLTNTILDYTLVPNAKALVPSLGLATVTPGMAVQGDIAMARHVLRQAYAPRDALPDKATCYTLYPKEDTTACAIIDMWLEYAASLSRLDATRLTTAAVLTVEKALRAGRTYVTGHALTLADLAMFSVLGFPTTTSRLQTVTDSLPDSATETLRWLRTLAAHPALQQATQLAMPTYYEVPDLVGAPTLNPLVPGMNPLEGAVPGQVVTRFPPEPSGYLHIGHAKAVLLNDYYATRYQGRLILRFDDTNPSKEKEEYQESIVVDLAKLGVKPHLVTFASDYFDVCMGYAKQMLAAGLAYMDDTPQEQMKEERATRQDSKHRNQTPDQALALFELMCDGNAEGGAWCLRAKIDMQSNNGTLRDPVLYRQNLTPHHRTGTTYKAYPTYDFSCPIVDSIEGVTHALRTTEYNDRDEQFQWIAKALGIRRPRNHAFSRVNFEYTVLSKRKLTWFVDQGHVTGWDDARFPTVRGVVRRGIHIAALRSFMYEQGASRNVVNMVWHKFWANNKKEIDLNAARYMAVDKVNHVVMTITNGPASDTFAFKEIPVHPKEESMGTRAVRLSNKVMLEKVDVDGMQVGDEVVLLRWGVVRITKVDLDSCVYEGEFLPDGDFQKKRMLSWMACVPDNTPVLLYEFDYLVTKAKLEEEDKFEDHVNYNSLATTPVLGDAGLKTLKEHDIIQLERRGYYRVDRPYVNESKPLELYMIPDGRSKSMGGMQGQFAHR